MSKYKKKKKKKKKKRETKKNIYFGHQQSHVKNIYIYILGTNKVMSKIYIYIYIFWAPTRESIAD